MRWPGSIIAIVALLSLSTPVAAQTSTSPSASVGATLNVEPNGHFEVRFATPAWTFAGDVGSPLANLRAEDAQDQVGAYHEVSFDTNGRTSAIRAYTGSPVVLFSTTYTAGGPNADPFPQVSALPSLPYKLSYFDTPFSPYQMNSLANAADSPWLFFDGSDNAFVISPASNFPVARMSLDGGTLRSGIDAGVKDVPAGFTHQTLLVAATGINHAFDVWGQVLTTLHNKTRPANDADLTLNKFGYWTDNGAIYYYHYEPDLGYAGTLLAVKRDLDQRTIPVGYLQLDSWWYPKGPNMRWDDTSGGIYRYRASPDLFPNGLPAFQQQVGLPLVTHARWIDPSSPYRGEFSTSGNVMTDRAYWDDLMSYLQSGNVVTYEQDWLGAQAQPVYDLAAPQQFMGNMATAAAQRGMTMQYCMPLPRHVLQTVEYNNVTSMRVSDDRFDRNRWDTFLYTSRFASALGVWPWSDVFMSTETNNLVLATLSAGVVGVGDALGATNADNVRHVMRGDAVLIKPDVPLVPTDDSIVAEAGRDATTPMVASTYTDHRGLRTLYVFAYARNGAPQSVSFAPAQLGGTSASYVYDVYADAGRLLNAGESYTASVTSGSYFIAAPIGPSGIALVGDAGAYAASGKKRLSDVSDDGAIHTTVEFAAGESSVTLHGYAPTAPTATASQGSVDPVVYDSATQRFRVDVHPRSQAAPSQVTVTIQ